MRAINLIFIVLLFNISLWSMHPRHVSNTNVSIRKTQKKMKNYVYIEKEDAFYELKAAYFRHKLKQQWDQLHRVHIPGSEEIRQIIRTLPKDWSLDKKEEFLINLIHSSMRAHIQKLKRQYDHMVILRECKNEVKK